ncbi:MAG: Holliday junction branch migration protein RuvA [Crocinitomicaceae bacterium]|nr:Holliday junction branch migration protein RuvA [Crocinitomicaceae bacterium]|tara:strand:- start:82 stop:666 length:585 start_codon:yes stop_codon:yes gene_type:complete
MITHIDGILEEKNPAYVIIDVNGIGYLLYITLNTYSEVPEKGRVRLLTQFVVREDAQLLYGFSSDQERKMFKALINVSGVGASTAMLILSSLKPEELVSAILTEDVELLKKIKGIGSKSAQRIIIDLKDKVSKFDIKHQISHSQDNTIKNEALSALAVLGVEKKKAEKIIDTILNKGEMEITVESLIKKTLKSL